MFNFLLEISRVDKSYGNNTSITENLDTTLSFYRHDVIKSERLYFITT